MTSYSSPGVYREQDLPPPTAELVTGVPVFLGATGAEPTAEPVVLRRPHELAQRFPAAPATPQGYLAAAVHGFFANGGKQCFVQGLPPDADRQALEQGLRASESTDEIDLVCVPDLAAGESASILPFQALVLEHCRVRRDRFALLDSLPAAGPEAVVEQRQGLSSPDAALYYPWVRPLGETRFVPPCGHVAGVIFRTDARAGVHKAPANELVESVSDLEVDLSPSEQKPLHEAAVNALRAFPGRGLRIWGARTLSAEKQWSYVHVRRLFLTAGRWVERHLAEVAFEPNHPQLWTRITRQLTAVLEDLYEAGALRGRSAREAFFVKCDEETNPVAVREAGRVVIELGLRPAATGELVVVRLIRSAEGDTQRTA